MARRVEPGTRVLLVRRISREDEESSALTRQDERLARAAQEGAWHVVGEVEDETVSGATPLDERPSLGPWMADPLWSSWDAIAVTDCDRIVRDQHRWELFAERCHQGGKEIISLADPGLDIHTPTGRMIAYVRATVAAEERQKVVQRRLDQLRWYRDNLLWPGGPCPYGYRAAKFTYQGKQRWRLEPDPVSAERVREAFRLIADKGWSVNAVARKWNSEGVPTSSDHQRIARGQPTRGSRWETTSLGRVLRNPALKGVAMRKGGPILRDGVPARWAEPVLTDAEFDRLQAALQVAGEKFTGRRGETSPWSGLIMCGCGRRMHTGQWRRADGTLKHYLRCASVNRGQPCPLAQQVPRDLVLSAVEHRFLTRLGDRPVTERRFVPGADHRPRIRELAAALENLSQAVAAAESPAAVAALTAAMDRHARELDHLKAAPVVAGRWEETGTGQTYGQLWAEMDGWAERGPLLRDKGFRAYVMADVLGDDPAAVAVYVVTPAEVGAATPGEWDATAHRAFLAAAKAER